MSSEEEHEQLTNGNAFESYSDEIDSDLETELYSFIHYEANLSSSLHCVPFNTSNDCIENGHESESSNVIHTTSNEFFYNSKLSEKDRRSNEILYNSEMFEVDRRSNKFPLNSTLNESSPSKKTAGDNTSQKLELNIISNSVQPVIKSAKKRKKLLKKFLPPTQYEGSSEAHNSSLKLPEMLFSSKPPKKKLKKTEIKSIEDSSSSELNLDSDSDYMIVDDANTDSESEFVTNLNSKDDILNMDSSSNDSLSSKAFNPYDAFVSGGTSDPWYTSPLDKELHFARKRKYAADRKYFCYKCKRPGHPKSFCTVNYERKCYMCAGDHSFLCCPNSKCGKCHQVGQHYTSKCKILGKCICSRCGMKGHLSEACPDLWRRYHLTTSSSKLETSEKLPNNRPTYCFNCGSQGHFGPLCTVVKRHHELPAPTWPAVISYENCQDSEAIHIKKKKKMKHKVQALYENAIKGFAKRKKKKIKKVDVQQNNFSVTQKNSHENDFPRTPKQKVKAKRPRKKPKSTFWQE